jgi:formate dehydrogenase iron-sulfur subunit
MFIASVAGSIAMLAGSLHLGQPRKAWRAFLGWRKSWFSREVIAMGLFLLFALLSACTMLSPATQPLAKLLVPFAALTGLLTVASSAMIYIATRRDFWNARWTLGKFFGTTLLLGAASALATSAFAGGSHAECVAAVVALAVATLAKLAYEREVFAHLTDEESAAQTPLGRAARLLAGELNGFVRVRIGCAILGGVLLPVIALLESETIPASVSTISLVAFGLVVAGESIERYLFFTAVVPQKMPGSLAS